MGSDSSDSGNVADGRARAEVGGRKEGRDSQRWSEHGIDSSSDSSLDLNPGSIAATKAAARGVTPQN